MSYLRQKYLDRLIFDLPIDWATQPGAGVSDSLRLVDNGISDPRPESDQTWARWSWEFEVNLDSAALIREWTIFFNASARGRMGSLRAWWLPVPQCPGRVVGVSGALLTLRGDGLVQAFEEFPELHLRLEDDVQWLGVKVLSVTDNEDGTVDAEVEGDDLSPVAAGWRCRRMALVRQSGEEESLEYESENRAIASVRVVEVPMEYAEAYEGNRVIYLYRFDVSAEGNEQFWKVTSFPWRVGGSVNPYLPVRIWYEGLHRSADGSRDGVTIHVDLESFDTPMRTAFPIPTSTPITVTISTFIYGVGEKVLFYGRVGEIQADGGVVTFEAKSIVDLASGTVPNLMLQRRCNYQLFSTPCGLNREDHEIAVNFAVGSNPLEVVLTGAGLAGMDFAFLAGGMIRAGSADPDQRQVRYIVKSEAESGGEVVITIDRPMLAIVSTNAMVSPGCDGRASTCSTKFSNFVNFGGHGFASDNLTLRALPSPKISGGKK